MELKFNIVSDDKEFAKKQSNSLKNWIEDEEELDINKIEQLRDELNPDDAGGQLLSAFKTFMGGNPIELIAKTVQVWLRERTKTEIAKVATLNLEIEKPDGTKVVIDVKNLGTNEKELLQNITLGLQDKGKA